MKQRLEFKYLMPGEQLHQIGIFSRFQVTCWAVGDYLFMLNLSNILVVVFLIKPSQLKGCAMFNLQEKNFDHPCGHSG